MVALDIQGAYDRVWHIGLFAKLVNLHVHPALLGCNQSFLSNCGMDLMVGKVAKHRQLTMGSS